MTKDEFIFLIMGFTGKKAAHLKEAYIGAFNKTEAKITQLKIENEKASTLQAPKQAIRVLMTLQNNITTASQIVPLDSIVISPSEIPNLIRAGEFIPTKDLPAILQAASETRLKRRLNSYNNCNTRLNRKVNCWQYR